MEIDLYQYMGNLTLLLFSWLFMASILWLHHSLLNFLGCFQSIVILNSAAVHFLICTLYAHESLSVGYTVRISES